MTETFRPWHQVGHRCPRGLPGYNTEHLIALKERASGNERPTSG